MSEKKFITIIFLSFFFYSLFFFIFFIENQDEKLIYEIYFPSILIFYIFYLMKRYVCINEVYDTNNFRNNTEILGNQVQINTPPLPQTDNRIIMLQCSRNTYRFNKENDIIVKTKFNTAYDNICTICLEEMNIETSICFINKCRKHIFHIKCGEILVKNNFKFCPVCNI